MPLHKLYQLTLRLAHGPFLFCVLFYFVLPPFMDGETETREN